MPQVAPKISGASAKTPAGHDVRGAGREKYDYLSRTTDVDVLSPEEIRRRTTHSRISETYQSYSLRPKVCCWITRRGRVPCAGFPPRRRVRKSGAANVSGDRAPTKVPHGNPTRVPQHSIHPASLSCKSTAVRVFLRFRDDAALSYAWRSKLVYEREGPPKLT